LVGGGASHFVTFSTYGRRNLLAAPEARDIVMAHLDALACDDRVKVSGFVIMPDHVHALLWFKDDRELAKVMNVWKTGSARTLRRLYEEGMPWMFEQLEKTRDGRVRISFWQTRYHDVNISSHDKARVKLGYMHHNPVKESLCSSPAQWRWSSYLWYFKGQDVGVKITPGF